MPMSSLLADVRYAMRSLVRAPVWTAALIATIAIGIGSSASVQGFVRGLLTTDLPLFAVRRVVTVFATDTSGASRPVPFGVFATLRNRTDIFESLGAIHESQQRVTIGARSTLMAMGHYTADVATVLPLPPAPGAALSHRLRFAQFPASADPAGTPVQVGEIRTIVTGWMPLWLEGVYRGRAIDLWMPLEHAVGDVWVLGRLRPGVTAAAAQAVIDGGITVDGMSFTVLPYTGQTPEAASGMLRVGSLLRMASASVFLIACANVAAFMLTRSWSRSRETAVRVAIGARRAHLLRQLLIDSAVLAGIGGAAGLLLATWMADIVPLMFFDADADRLVFSPDARAILLTSLLCMAITVACGLAPLFETRDDDPSVVLQREVAGASKTMMRIGNGLIVLQMAACSLLVISTGMMLQGFRTALTTKAGRDLGNPILATLEALPSPAPDEGQTYFAAAIAAAASTAPITATAWAARLPGARPAWQWVRFDPPQSEWRGASLQVTPLTATALERLSLPPVSGRLFGPTDSGECGAVVLNDAAAMMLFEGHPIGRLIATTGGRSLEVVGVAREKDASAEPGVYDHPASSAPLGVDGRMTLLAPPPAELGSGLIDINIVSPEYFELMGLTHQDGSLFEARGGGCRVGVVNEEAARRYFGGNAIGGAVIDGTGRRTEIVGVVRSAQLRSAQRLVEPALFLPMSQDYLPRMTAILVTPHARAATIEAIQRRIAAVPGGRPDRLVVTTLDKHLSNTSLATERIATTLVATFAAMAIALGALGLYGLMADAARRRQREFATRLALGAQGWRVVRLVMAEGMRFVAVGATVGMLASLIVQRWLTAIVPAPGWPSPVIWIAPVMLLAAAVVIAGVIPARRVLSVDLVSLMRDM
jgi:ABC-type lipoprotein release transport system permease subunit